MIDWGSFALKTGASDSGKTGLDLLDGTASRGLSMARTLGSEEADQVSKAGRRVLIGWTGPADGAAFGGQGSAQSLPRELSLAADKSVLQRFVSELQILRKVHQSTTKGGEVLDTGADLQAEVLARFPASCGESGARCALSLLDDGAAATVVTLDPDAGLVSVDATAQGNTAVRAGPLPAAAADGGGWSVHAYVDHSLVELIVNNATALVVYAAPADATATGVSLSSNVGDGASLDAWTLAAANNTI